MLDEFAEGFARHVHAGKGDQAGVLPGGDAAIEIGNVGIAGARQHGARALRQPIVVVAQHDARVLARHQARKAQFEPRQRHVARPQQMVLRKGQFLAHVDEREFAAVAEHRLDGGGPDCAQFRGGNAGVQIHDAPMRIVATSPVFRSILMRSILSRFVPVTRTKRALSG